MNKNLNKTWTWTLAVLLAACVAVPPVAVADSCGSWKSGVSDHDMKFGGRDRSYRLFLPRNADGKTRLPLLIALHGAYGSGKQFEGQTGFDDIAGSKGFAVVYPDGFKRSWAAGVCCDPAMSSGIDDLGYMAAIVNQLSSEACIDKSRVFAAGFSNGAFLTQHIACERPGFLKGFATVSGTLLAKNPVSEQELAASCPKAAATPALLIQGEADPRVFWKGGEFQGTYRPPVTTVVSVLAKRNHCGGDEKVTEQHGDVTCKTRQGCSGGPVTYCGVAGAGHQWLGGETVMTWLLGKNSKELNASQKIMDFFASIR